MDEYQMGIGDKALERIIAELTSAIAMTGDPRLVRLKDRAERYARMGVVQDDLECQPFAEVIKNVGDLMEIRETQQRLFNEAKGTSAIWSAIRQIYRLEQPAISNGEYDPYIVDWQSLFTPIESELWCAIRCFGRRRFFPQYPVGRYFLDFGDPWQSIAIECDGARWHNAKKDAARDYDLRRAGWTVHRIKGRDCFANDDERRSCFGLLRSLFGNSEDVESEDSEDAEDLEQ